MKIGIIGLANVGKSSLFQALTKKQVVISNYPFATIDPNVAVLPIADKRLTAVGRILNSAEIFPTTIEVIDIAGLIQGAHKGEGLGNQFLSHIRHVDALIHVVRTFSDENVTRNEGSIDPEKDIHAVCEELRLKDEEKNEKVLSIKSTLYVFNTSDKDDVTQQLLQHHSPSLAINIKQELEAATLSLEEQKEIGFESRLPELIMAVYRLLNLITFFTANKNEARAHALKDETTAYEAAGLVHSDFQEKFIRADVINWKTLVDAGSWVTAKQKGLVRSQSKEYLIRDGDMVEFKI